VEKDHARALALYETALHSAPNDVALLTSTSGVEQSLGRWEAALQHARRARALDPRAPLAVSRLTGILLRLRRYPEATAAADTARILAPTSLTIIENRVMVLLGQGDLAGARAVLQAAASTMDRAALLPTSPTTTTSTGS
jgi:Flp pilus assembly protein TadD